MHVLIVKKRVDNGKVFMSVLTSSKDGKTYVHFNNHKTGMNNIILSQPDLLALLRKGGVIS